MAISFAKTIKPRDARVALIVDSLNVSFRYKHAGIVDFAENLKSTIESLAQSYGCGTILVLADKGGSSYRKGIDPSYKSGRAEEYANQTEEERQDFQEFLDGYAAALELLREVYPVLQYKGVEADDVAAFITNNLEKFGLTDAWLISSDKDWDLLISDRVSRFSTVTRKEVTVDNWPYDVEVEQYIGYKCLMGDKGDSVPGVDKIGPKRAAALLEEYGDLQSIIDALPIDSKYVHIKNLNQSKDRLLLNKRLMDLVGCCEEAIGEFADDIAESVVRSIGNNASSGVAPASTQMDDDI